MLSLNNGVLSIKIDENMGGEIRSIRMGKSSFLADFDWLSPIQNSKSSSYNSAILDWLSDYRGGWQVLFPNAGNENTVMGVPLPFHGEFGRTQTKIMSKKKNEVIIEAGARLPLVLRRTYKLMPNKPILQIKQSVSNESDSTIPFVWGEHPAFSLPRGSKINLPPGPILVDENELGELQDVKPGSTGSWPFAPDRVGGKIDLSVVPSENVERLCYLHDRPEGWAAMEHGRKVIGISWDIEAFPHLWFWQEIGGKGFPWFGRSRITAIEPASSWPSFGLEEAMKSGQAFYLKPGEIRSAWTTFSVSTVSTKDIMKIKSIDSKGTFHIK